MKRVFSGVQPTGNLHLGNYLGAIRNWVALQEDYECIYCVVDQHAITVFQHPAELTASTREVAAGLIAAGIDPEKHILFNQSQNPDHANLAWVFNCIARLGWLNRMTQFKEKAGKHRENASVGLYAYPNLMAADILAYKATHVPVGEDQKQHLELSRNLAERFNHRYSDTFTVPEPYIPKSSGRIMSLQDPSNKMSKSDENENNFIALIDDEDTIIRKIKRAVTDSDSEIVFSDDKPGLKNLITIYSCYSGLSPNDIQDKYVGKMYSDFKQDLGELIAESLKPVRERYNELISEKEYLNKILSDGAQRASYLAQKTVSKVYRKIGLIKK